jgi:phosphoribosyl-ATP pyrophosphohydrolase
MVYLQEIVKIKMNEQIIKELFTLLIQRKKISEKQSYTSYLIKNPEILAKKIGEESSELIIDFVKKNKQGVIRESADLIYHILVIWVSLGVNPDEIWDELSSRKVKSGIEEKKNRGVK